MRVHRIVPAGALFALAACVGPDEVEPLPGDPSSGTDPEIHLPEELTTRDADSLGASSAPDLDTPVGAPPGADR